MSKTEGSETLANELQKQLPIVLATARYNNQPSEWVENINKDNLADAWVKKVY